MSRCKSGCPDPITWATTVKGAAVPLNATPVVLVLDVPGADGLVEIVRGREAHFATCSKRRDAS